MSHFGNIYKSERETRSSFFPHEIISHSSSKRVQVGLTCPRDFLSRRASPIHTRTYPLGDRREGSAFDFVRTAQMSETNAIKDESRQCLRSTETKKATWQMRRE